MEKEKSDQFSINNIHKYKEKKKVYRFAREKFKKVENQNFKKTNYHREISNTNSCSCCFWIKHYKRADGKTDFYNEVKRVYEKKSYAAI